MTAFTIFWKVATKELIVGKTNGNTPEGYTVLSSFEHDGLSDPLGTKDNHVIWHHIRDALYHVGVYDMAYVSTVFYPQGFGPDAPSIGCIYGMGASQEDLTMYGLGTRASLSNDDMKMSYTILGDTLITYSALPSLGFGQAIDLTTGTTAIAFDITMPEMIFTSSLGTDWNIGSISINSISGGKSLSFTINANNRNYPAKAEHTLKISGTSNPTTYIDITDLTDTTFRLVFLLKADNTFSVYLNAVEQVLESNVNDLQFNDCILMYSGVDREELAGGIGNTYSIEIVKKQFGVTLPVGTKNICGEVLS